MRSILRYMPTEMMDDVALYLPRGDTVMLMRTCRKLHDIGARVLYRNVALSDLRARLFFRTIAENSMMYASAVKSLHYTAMSNEDVFLTYSMFCDAILNLEELRSLTLTIPLSISSLLHHQLVRRSVIRSNMFHPTTHTDFLPKLECISLNGNILLSELAKFRCTTNVCMTYMMDAKDIKEFVSCIADGGTNTVLSDMVITLHPSTASPLRKTMLMLDSAVPNLQTLVIRTPSANALEASETLAAFPPIFRSLRKFCLNDWSILDAVFMTNEDEAIRLQRTHIDLSADMRGNLEDLAFGPVHWERTMTRAYIKWTVHKAQTQSASSYDVAPESVDLPLFWEVFYIAPPRH
ncbi:hypothetical protein CVT26_011000 [Gymnopilus dilepis]|uniref:F-box domain-containing protein n=1 Tax=Gymnopilus dilepis TaxID=231916 RepID=A0A409VY67_9AGAR|nr:hypothetical protein CVT26_011000 [Gymnopilus dilepis]